MVTERGTVVRLTDGDAVVRIPRDSQCRKCPGCVASENGMGMLAQVTDPLGVHVGDEVEISNSRMRPVMDGAILLLLPIILFIAGYAVGIEYLPAYAAIPLSLAVGAVPIAYIRRKERKGAYKLHVVRVIPHHGTLDSYQVDTDDATPGLRPERQNPITFENLPEALRIRNSQKNSKKNNGNG